MGYELDQECFGIQRFAFCAEECEDICILCEPLAGGSSRRIGAVAADGARPVTWAQALLSADRVHARRP